MQQTHTTTALTDIPLNQLHRSPLNARKTGGTAVEELAASIASGGLIQNLVVVPETKGKRAGFGVVAGGRRLAALQALVRAKIFEADIDIPCRIVTVEEATELSLAENHHRETMHPADQFAAWAKLVDAGRSAEDIAARHGVSVATVERRLMLARVSPRVMDLFRADDLTLDQVMAFTLTEDHAAQAALLDARSYLPSAQEIRRSLTETSIAGNDARARYVGEKAYIAAGGTVRRDMFDERSGAYFEDPQLVEQLVTAKLDRAAERLRREFAWVEVIPGRIDYRERSRYGTVPTIQQTPDAKTAKRLTKLSADLEAAGVAVQAIEDGPESDENEDAWTKASEHYDALAAQIEDIESGLQQPDPDAAALAGAIIGLGYDGRLEKHLNLLRPEDKAKLRRTAQGDDTASRGDLAPVVSADDDPQSVRADLSTYLTAITQEALAENVPLALRALAYSLAARWGNRYSDSHGVGVRMDDHADLPVSDTLANSAIESQRRQRQTQWESDLPEDEALWAWCLAADDHTITSLLAYCTARSLAGTQFHAGHQPMAPLMTALGIDVVAHWQPNAAYFRRIKKATTVSVLAAHGHTAPELAKAKRDALAERAEQLLGDSGWLAPTLRTHPSP